MVMFSTAWPISKVLDWVLGEVQLKKKLKKEENKKDRGQRKRRKGART